jgi:membrane protein DedA with SNARE-associated domain
MRPRPDRPGSVRRPPQLWDGAPQRADKILLAGLVICGIYSLALIPATPSLVGSHPVLLELLRSNTASIVTVGGLVRTGHASIVVAVLAAIPGYMMFDWLYWWAGQRWGERALQSFLGAPRQAEKRLRRLESATRRFGPVAIVVSAFLPVPSPLIYAAAGMSGMRLRVFLLLDLCGALLWAGVLVSLGYALGQSAVDVARSITHYALYITIALVVLIVAQQMWASRPERASESPS